MEATPILNQPRQSRSLATLRDDNRGAIMVVGVFMAAFLVGALWYIIGIGDAILYKERMQDGADAVAYAAAVYHARGMNIIAMLNIIMAAILAVLVAFKLLQAINTLANVIFCAISAWPGGQWAVPYCTTTGGLKVPISEAVNTAEGIVNATLPVLSKTQVAIAVSMPWVAQAKSVYIATHDYKKTVTGGGIVTISLIPSKERLGLPVQEDTYKFLCKKAGEYVGEIVFSPFPAGLRKGIAGAVGSIVSWFPGYFCGDSGGGGSSFSGGMTEGALNDVVKQACKKNYDNAKGDEKKNFDMKKCRKDTKKKMKKDMAQKGAGNSGSTGGNGKTPKKVYWAAKNGNGYFQIWSIVLGDQSLVTRGDKGVSVANWDKGDVKPTNLQWGKVAFAQAEFYYDESGDWDDMKKDAMWNMRWRARLRRVRTPAPTVASILANDVLGAILDKLSPASAAIVGSSEVVGWLLGNVAGSVFEKQLGKLQQTGSGKFNGSSYVKNPKLNPMGPIDIIH